MDGWDPDEEPTGESYHRMPPRRSHPREDPASEGGLTSGNRRRPGSRRLRSARRRVGNTLRWVGLLVFAPLIAGILAGALGQHFGL